MSKRKIIWNQLFSNSSSSALGTQKVLSGGVFTVTGTATGFTHGSNFGPTIKLVNGHKYLHQVFVRKFSNSSGAILRSRIRNNYLLTYSASTGSAIFTASADRSIRYSLYYQEIGDTFDVDMVQGLFDLTLMFGAGNEPSTVAEFEAIFPLDVPYPYNPGEERYL